MGTQKTYSRNSEMDASESKANLEHVILAY